MSLKFIRMTSLAAVSAFVLSACISAGGYTPAEQEIADTMGADKYQPATRDIRNSIETQDLFAQAAFWSREYNLNPGDLEAAIKLSAAVRKMGNPSKAIEISQTSRALYPKDPYLAAEYAAALIADNRANEAIQPLDQALRTSSGYARLWSLKGAALDQAEQYDLARKHYARAMQITPNDPNIMANVGLSFALQGDAKSAEGWLRRAAAVPGASDSVKQNLALVLQLQGKNAEAEKYAVQPKQSQSAGLPSAYVGPFGQARQAPIRKTSPAPQTGNYGPMASAPQIKTYEGARSTIEVSGDPNRQAGGGPRTASEAARAAAQNQRRRRGTASAAQTPEQQAVLAQIARTLGPQAAGSPNTAAPRQPNAQPPVQSQPAYPPQLQTYPGYGQPPAMHGQPTYRQPAYGQPPAGAAPNMYPQQQRPQPRPALRRRG